MSTRKTQIVLPSIEGASIPSIGVTIEGFTEKAPAVHRYCAVGHDPVQVKQNTACPDCGNSDFRTFTRGVEAGGNVAVITEEQVKADHSKAMLSAHDREEFSNQTLTEGKVYAVKPQPGSETMYQALKAVIERNPDIAYVTTWGWTATKTNIWLVDVQMGHIVFREAQHPKYVKQLAAPKSPSNSEMEDLIEVLIDTETFNVDTFVDHNEGAKKALATLGVTKTVKVEATVDPMAQLKAAAAIKKAKAKAAKKSA
jgi:hypothetical protein